MGNWKRGLDGWCCQGRRLGHHIIALGGAKIRVGIFAGLVVSVVVTVVTAVVLDNFVDVRVVTLGVVLIVRVLLVNGSLVTLDLGFSVDLITTAGFNSSMLRSVLTPIGRPFEVKLVGTFRMFVCLRKESKELMLVLSLPVRGFDT